MLLSPKWQTMWLESQHCSKSIVNVPLPTQQTQKVLEDLRISCCSPNKAVQLEALKCWGIWINNQNLDDWKLNSVCFTAVRPLITKKLQPLHKDVDICKIRLSLLWALLVKVQNIMHLEGPQYILEVFLQSCLTWLSSSSGDGHGNEISNLIFQLLLAILKKEETLNGCVKEMFPQFSTNIFHVRKVYHQFVDKFLNIFIHWRKVQDKNVILKLWKHFLEQCELSCEHIPIPVWHKIFKLAAQICSEKSEPVKERLAFLHTCATTLKSALSSSKFIDIGNLLTTPCEALLKKLVELCTVEFNEFFDSEMFFHSKEICEVLSNRSVAIGGFDLCISVLDILEEFWLRSLFWGVWCGLVYCYQVQLRGTNKIHFTKTQMKFYRKLRGVAINFELDKNKLNEDCIEEVKKRIDVLNISCFCNFPTTCQIEKTRVKDCKGNDPEMDGEYLNPSELQSIPISYSKEIVKVGPSGLCGKFSKPALPIKSNLILRQTINLKFDLIKDILKSFKINSAEPLFNCLFNFRFITLKITQLESPNILVSSNNPSLCLTNEVDDKKEKNISVPCLKAKPLSRVLERSAFRPVNRERDQKIETDEEIISIRKTRSRKRAEEEEEKKTKMERQMRKKRKSFEVLVQEIVRKNKERKTEKNCRRRKSPVMLKSKRIKKKVRESEKENKTEIKKNNKKLIEVSERVLRNSRKKELRSHKREKKPVKADGKLENYFKVIARKSGSEVKKEEKKSQKKKKTKGEKKPMRCCNSKREGGEKKCESGWRQTSLKAMMKNKTGKVKQGLRARGKSADVTDEKIKVGNEKKKVIGSVLAKLSPFKEVFHDHEYAKSEPENLQRFEKVLLDKKKTVKGAASKKRKKSEKIKPLRLEEIKPDIKVIKEEEEEEHEKLKEEESSKLPLGKEEFSETVTLQFIPFEESTFEFEAEKLKTPEQQNLQREQEEKRVSCETEELANILAKESEMVKTIERQSPTSNVGLREGSQEIADVEYKFSKRGRKRVKMLDSLKPSNKKIRLEGEILLEETLPLDVTEKENLEEKPEVISQTEKEKTIVPIAKNNGSLTPMNRVISSRALRMIALVPESTKGGQMQRESSNRVEIFRCKKAPNVDKNSRASKMLALLSENVVEFEEVEDLKVEEFNSSKVISSTPNTNTPMSSLKSPKSIRKRRSIRFDDAKNETVLYETDTPPSQILKEKEKCRGIGPSEIILNLP